MYHLGPRVALNFDQMIAALSKRWSAFDNFVA
jgi:hypothetical protein